MGGEDDDPRAGARIKNAEGHGSALLQSGPRRLTARAQPVSRSATILRHRRRGGCIRQDTGTFIRAQSDALSLRSTLLCGAWRSDANGGTRNAPVLSQSTSTLSVPALIEEPRVAQATAPLGAFATWMRSRRMAKAEASRRRLERAVAGEMLREPSVQSEPVCTPIEKPLAPYAGQEGRPGEPSAQPAGAPPHADFRVHRSAIRGRVRRQSTSVALPSLTTLPLSKRNCGICRGSGQVASSRRSPIPKYGCEYGGSRWLMEG
jgi:hypothetical protein